MAVVSFRWVFQPAIHHKKTTSNNWKYWQSYRRADPTPAPSTDIVMTSQCKPISHVLHPSPTDPARFPFRTWTDNYTDATECSISRRQLQPAWDNNEQQRSVMTKSTVVKKNKNDDETECQKDTSKLNVGLLFNSRLKDSPILLIAKKILTLYKMS